MKASVNQGKHMKIQQILESLDRLHISYDFYGDKEKEAAGYSCLQRCIPGSVLMVNDLEEAEKAEGKAALFVSEERVECGDTPCLVVRDKEEAYVKIVSMFFFFYTSTESADSVSLAQRFPSAEIDLGENVWIAEDGVVLSGKIKLGNNVIIKAGAVIGQDGYEFVKDKQGRQCRIPPQGGVIIGDGVEIGANTCIDRGIYGDTIIGEQVKISNLCQIAHDVIIGKNTMLATKVSVSSFTEVGQDCVLSAGATIKDKIQIGDGVFVGMGAVVTDSIRGRHSVFGNPAVEYQRKQKLLKVDHINKTYGNDNQKTLADITFEIATGEFISVVGPSGCGKSTLLKIMAGLLDSDAGQLLAKKKNGVNIGMIFQEDTLFPWFTVEKNIDLGLKIQKAEKDARKERTAWALKVVGLKGYEKYYPHQLSGGMKKRVAIARSLVLNSELLLMDEPFGALDAVTKAKIQEDLLRLQKENGFSICMVTHDIEEAVALSDRILVVSGKPAEVKTIISVNLADRRNHNSDEFLAVKRMILSMIEGE